MTPHRPWPLGPLGRFLAGSVLGMGGSAALCDAIAQSGLRLGVLGVIALGVGTVLALGVLAPLRRRRC